MTEFWNRLQQAARYAGVEDHQAGIAKALNISRQTVSRWANGTAEPNAKMLLHIARVWSIDAEWLKNETSSMLPKPSEEGLLPEERELIKNYRSATPQVRTIIRTMARAVRKSIVTIALAIPPLMASQPSDASVLHNACCLLNTHWRRMMRAWLCVLSTSPVLA